MVAQNFVRHDTTGTIEEVDAKYELLQRGQYVQNLQGYVPVKVDPKGPLQLAEAENAVEIARLTGAGRYASDTFQKATIDLQNARDFLMRSHDRKRSETNAREAAQMAEDARIITFRKIRDEELANERAAAAQREADERAKAAESAEQARLEQQRRREAEDQRQEAERAKPRRRMRLQHVRRRKELPRMLLVLPLSSNRKYCKLRQKKPFTSKCRGKAMTCPLGCRAGKAAGRIRKNRAPGTSPPAVERCPGDPRNCARFDRQHL